MKSKPTTAHRLAAFVRGGSGHEQAHVAQHVVVDGPGSASSRPDQSGKFLVVGNYTGGTVFVLPVGTDGKLRPALQQFQQQGPRAAGAASPEPGAHQVVFSQDNRFLIVPDKALDRVFVYRFDAATVEYARGVQHQPRYRRAHGQGRSRGDARARARAAAVVD